MQHSRHRSVHVFRSCVREVNLLDGANLVTKVGLLPHRLVGLA